MWWQLDLDFWPPQDSLIFKVGKRRYRLELQSPEEVVGDSCEGCAFQSGQHCVLHSSAMASCALVPAAVDLACSDNTAYVWKEISQG